MTARPGMPDPEVSIVIPTRDRPQLLVRAVTSALAQTMPDVEVLVVDDGSAEPVRLDHDGRVRVLRQEQRRGPCTARNLAMAAASGRWITFLDDDDELEPDMLEVSLAAALESDLPRPVAVLSGIDVVGNDGRVLQRRLPVTLPRGRRYSLEHDQGRSFVTHNTLVAPLEVLRSIGGWDETLPAWEHDDLFLRLNAVCSIQGVDRVAYRMTANASVRLSENLLARAVGIERTLAKHRAAFAANHDRYAYMLGALGRAYLRAGRWAPAVAASSRLLCIRPSPRACGWWLASLAGPRAVAVTDRIRAWTAGRERRTRAGPLGAGSGGVPGGN
jgi:glycosyltransferase involved in cell wall biosynthesis